MPTAEAIRQTLCKTFCGDLSVRALAAGFAVSSSFEDSSGDRFAFYIAPSDGGFRIEDDGSYLAHLVARDVPIDKTSRGQMLDSILAASGAFWDRETYEIKTADFPAEDLPRRALDFLAAIIRVRNLELLTRDAVRSTFREDAIGAISRAVGSLVTIEENEPVSVAFGDFPADILLRPADPKFQARVGAIFLANSNERLSEALLLKMEAERLGRADFEVIALLDKFQSISARKFQRAQNRDLAMPIFREDEDAAAQYIRRRLGLPESATAH